MHTVVRYYQQLTLRPKTSIKINCLLPGTHLYVIYDIYVTFPTTPIEIIKMCSIVSFNKLYNEYLGFRYNIPKRQLTDYFKTANSLFIS